MEDEKCAKDVLAEREKQDEEEYQRQLALEKREIQKIKERKMELQKQLRLLKGIPLE